MILDTDSLVYVTEWRFRLRSIEYLIGMEYSFDHKIFQHFKKDDR